MKRRILIYAFLALFLAFGCGQSQRGSQTELKIRKFPSLTPPTMLQEQGEIIAYMSQHFWDGLLQASGEGESYRSDSLYIAGVEKGEVEQHLANYIYMLDALPLKEARKCMASLESKAEACEMADTASIVFESFIELIDKYLYDPNSPLRNEDYYQPFAAKLSQSKFLQEPMRLKYAYAAKMSLLNAVGTKAADFEFSDKRGKMYSLHEIKSRYTLLFFSNPGCDSCFEIITNLKNNPRVNAMIAQKQLAVLNIYIDEDIAAWRDYMPIYPETWYNGFDPNLIIRADNIYNVRAIPSLYLLDEQKTVLLKDATPEKLFNYIDRI